jgi:hypothetical protein
MKIVIEVDGDKISAISGEHLAEDDVLPAEPSPELLARAKKLGAMNAGAANFMRGAALASSTPSIPIPPPGKSASRPAKKAAARRRKK